MQTSESKRPPFLSFVLVCVLALASPAAPPLGRPAVRVANQDECSHRSEMELEATSSESASDGLGLAGVANGRLRLAAAADGVPTGRLDLALAGASRSGLVASSQPADLALAAALTRTGLAARLVMASGGRTIGRAQLRSAPFGSTGIAGFASAGTITELTVWL